MNKKPRFAHFVIDDKFINDSALCFKNADLTNNDYYYVKFNNRPIDFIKDLNFKTIELNEVSGFFQSCENYDVVCLHSLFAVPIKLIPYIHPKVKVLWYGWGYDIYNFPQDGTPLLPISSPYLPETQIAYELENSKEPFLLRARKFFRHLLGRNISSKDMINAISRIDFFSGVFPTEFDMLKNKYENFHAGQIIHNYIHPQEFQKSDLNSVFRITGNNIQLGHSATKLGNHIDIMKMIVDDVEDDVDIICPLSYAGTPTYVERVIEKGRYFFGDRFKPLVDFMPFDEYSRVMSSCSRFVLGTIRQMATCNCLTALWNGVQLYMLENSMNYVQYKDMGLNVYSIEKDFGKKLDFAPRHNRTIIEQNYSYRRWVEDLKNSIDLL